MHQGGGSLIWKSQQNWLFICPESFPLIGHHFLSRLRGKGMKSLLQLKCCARSASEVRSFSTSDLLVKSGGWESVPGGKCSRPSSFSSQRRRRAWRQTQGLTKSSIWSPSGPLGGGCCEEDALWGTLHTKSLFGFWGFLWSHHQTSTTTELYKPFLPAISSKAALFKHCGKRLPLWGHRSQRLGLMVLCGTSVSA